MKTISDIKQAGSGVQRVVEAIEDASQGSAGDLVRWDGLRRLRGPLSNGNILIPLDNDGTLLQQLEGMNRWCLHFARQMGVSSDLASYLALAYTARQLDGRNVLLNAQNIRSGRDEAGKLAKIAEAVLDPAGDTEAHAVFWQVGRQLAGHEGKNVPLAKTLEAARAAFYVETGVSALIWLKFGSDLWVHDKAEELTLPQALVAEETGHAVCRVAANAYHNNARTLWRVSSSTLKTLVEDVVPEAFWRLLYKDYYDLSCALAKSAEPSYDKAPKRPCWPLILRQTNVRDQPFAYQV